MRTLVLIDGEHYPPVVRAAIEDLPDRIPGAVVVGRRPAGRGEKLAADLADDLGLGLPVVRGDGLRRAPSQAGLRRFAPDLVVDLSDEPVLDARQRMGLAARTLVAGVPYLGADFRFDPPPRPRIATKPSIAVIGTGKRTGKTAVSASLARLLAERGTPPVVVAMGRGGPAEPELVDPATFDLSAAGLVALAASGRHAASDHLEDALVAGVATVGTRRCGGGLAGAPFASTFAAGRGRGQRKIRAVAGVRGKRGIRSTGPRRRHHLRDAGVGRPGAGDRISRRLPVVAERPDCGYHGGAIVRRLGRRRSDRNQLPELGFWFLEESVRKLVPGVRVVHTVFRPFPLGPISGRRVFYVTTAPASASKVLVDHLEQQHGCTVVGVSHHLARPARVGGRPGGGTRQPMSCWWS